MQWCEESTPSPDFHTTELEQATALLLTNMYSLNLSDPGKMAHPVLKQAFHGINSEIGPEPFNRLFNA
jgi:hypothetical protein